MVDIKDNKIILTATKCKPNNSSEIEKDAEGYYKVRLGAFNVYNSQGAFYTFNGIKELLTSPDSVFYKRLKKGYLHGELNHPKMTPGMTIQQFIHRNTIVDMDNRAFHLRDIIIKDSGEKIANSPIDGNVMIVEGWVKPMGPKGKYLQEALDNPNVNVAFSIRSISSDYKYKGIILKDTKNVFGWDYVPEPGIALANTFDMKNGIVNAESKDSKSYSLNSESVVETKEFFIIRDTDISNMIEDITSSNMNHESSGDIEIAYDIMHRAFNGKDAKSRILAW